MLWIVMIVIAFLDLILIISTNIQDDRVRDLSKELKDVEQELEDARIEIVDLRRIISTQKGELNHAE